MVRRQFEGTATVLLKSAQEAGGSLVSRMGLLADLLPASLSTSLRSQIETEIDILSSRAVIGRVVDSLRLQASIRRPAGTAYIVAAGGYSRVADWGGTSVRQPNGEVAKASRVLVGFRTEPEPGPGAAITVPARAAEDKTDVVALFDSIPQIVASMVAVTVVAVRR